MLAEMDAYCVANAAAFLAWAADDPRIVGLFPFYWPSTSTMVGLRDLPRCRSKWVEVGRGIVAGAAAETLAASALRAVLAHAALRAAALARCRAAIAPAKDVDGAGDAARRAP